MRGFDNSSMFGKMLVPKQSPHDDQADDPSLSRAGKECSALETMSSEEEEGVARGAQAAADRGVPQGGIEFMCAD